MLNKGRKGLGNMKRITLVIAFALTSIFTIAKPVSAQEILLEGPLAGAPAVRKQVKYRQLRFSVGPQFGYTINNHYMHNIMLGGKLEFNILDWLAVGAVGYGIVNAPTKLTEHVSNSSDIGGSDTTPAASNFPSYTGSRNFENQVALQKGLLLGQVSVVPFRGKLAMFEKLFIAIDGYVFVGGGVVIFKERENCEFQSSATSDLGPGVAAACGSYRVDENGYAVEGSEVVRETNVNGTFTFGIGFTAYFNDWLGFNLELRAAPFKWNEGGTDEAGQSGGVWEVVNDNGTVVWEQSGNPGGDYPDKKINDDDRQWTLNMSLGVGFIFHFPLHPRISE